MKLVVTIDVEEEGLFRGHYDSTTVSFRNVPLLRLLEPLFREFNIRPTLLVTYPVACHAPYRALLCQLKEEWNAEIGAHLHPWNTPPLTRIAYPEPVPSERIPRHILREKLGNLLSAIQGMGIEPVSFRMGRFNMGPTMFSILEETDILVDSSIAPMRSEYGGPDHLCAPVEPYFPDSRNPCSPGSSRIMEAPVTILPIYKGLGSLLHNLSKRLPFLSPAIAWFAMDLGSMPVQPLWTGLRRLQAAALMHRRGGGKVLTIHFHSSELMPGGSPQIRNAGDVERFLEKLRKFLSWLNVEMEVKSLTLHELREHYLQRKSHVCI